MDAKAILKMDMSTVGEWIGRGLSWWWNELQAALPAKMRSRLGSRASIVAEFSGEQIVLHEYPGGNVRSPVIDASSKAQIPQSIFALPASAVLLREMTLPALAPADLRRLVALDLDRLTPLRSDNVLFDVERGEMASDGRCQITIGIIRRQTIEALLERLRGLDANPPKAISLVDPRSGLCRFDFLKAWRMAEGRDVPLASRTIWWVAVSILMLANIALLIARDVAAVNDLQKQVTGQQPSVALAGALRRRVGMEYQNRQLLLRLRTERAPLPLLAAVTHTLPDSAYVQRFEWNGATLHLTGEARPGTDVSALFRAKGKVGDLRPAGSARQMPAGAFDFSLERGAGGSR